MSVYAEGEVGANGYSIVRQDTKDKNMQSFFSHVSLHLFSSVRGLFDQVDTWFAEIGVEGSPGSDLGVSNVLHFSRALKFF